MSEQKRQKRAGQRKNTKRREMRRVVEERKMHPTEPSRFPNKDDVHPHKPSNFFETSNDANDPQQTGHFAKTDQRRRQRQP
jgi:hypothetical protein